MWAQEKDKLYIDLFFNLDFTVVEFSDLKNKSQYFNLRGFTIRFPKLWKCWELSVRIALKLEDKASSLLCHLRSCSMIWEAQNQYCVQLNLWMEHNYHTSVYVGPGYWFVMFLLFRKSKRLNCCKEPVFHDSFWRLHHLTHLRMYLPYTLSLFL